VLATVPAPVARLPAFDLDPLGRQDGNDLGTRWRWRYRHVDFGLELRHGRNCGDRGAGTDQHATEQAAAREVVHLLLRTGHPE
jgi:hypothetical protein